MPNLGIIFPSQTLPSTDSAPEQSLTDWSILISQEQILILASTFAINMTPHSSIIILGLALAALAAAGWLMRQSHLAKKSLYRQADPLSVPLREEQNTFPLSSQLSAPLIHDLKQPMSAILINAQASLKHLRRQSDSPDSLLIESLMDIISDVGRLNTLAHGLTHLLAPEKDKEKAIHLNNGIREALTLFNGKIIKNRLQIESDLSAPLPELVWQPYEVTRCVVCVTLKFIEKLTGSPSGSRKIQVFTSSLGEDEAQVHWCATGIPASAFHLGESYAQEAIKRRGGSITLSPYEKSGTQVTLHIPLRSPDPS